MQGLNYGILLLNFGNCEGSKTNLHQPETRCDWNESSTRLGLIEPQVGGQKVVDCCANFKDVMVMELG
ncbi:hypothetical protein Gasu2_65550 [Galdieria sulphuraria]|nr:hypothetical protein Gasu2_15150 [Galdieria sulphuraria]GJD11500.1 hypothetical protein Gasu2_56350 [Galdieria sulphuraria]GJD12206.1 hypothetical protein Gasu2_63120 [Galdieria sulphuraria]GJD12474.1 hypothetical protein Gasu2_65550 [Galdieria sulphuraria]